MLIRGGCHCANISFELDGSPSPSEIPARACDCLFLYEVRRRLDGVSAGRADRPREAPRACLPIRVWHAHGALSCVSAMRRGAGGDERD